MINNLSATNSIISQWISEMRDTTLQNDRLRFRRNLERIGEVIAYEISKLLPYQEKIVSTPLGTATCRVLEVQPVIATILRAGLPMHQGLLNFFDGADNAFIGAYRKHNAEGGFVIDQQYVASQDITGRPLIMADTMLATGASLILALKTLLAGGTPTQLHIVCAIASAEGIKQLETSFPDAHIWVGVIDPELSAANYIVPGLGDAGDLAYGEKKQF